MLTEKRNSGKSTAVYALGQHLPGYWRGVVCVPILENGEKVGSNAVDLMTGKQIPFARASGKGTVVGCYRVRGAGMTHGRSAIQHAAVTTTCP